jgi:cobalt-zinc-cadmium efflux system membrane fusion protein
MGKTPVKRIARGLVLVVLGALLVYVGVAATRPGWLPAWARLDFDRLPTWARLDRLDRDDDEKRPAEPRPAASGGTLADVRLKSAELARRIGIETVAAVKERHAHRLTCNAETAYDMRRAAEVLPRVAGVVREVRVDLGQRVKRSDVLAVVDAAQVGASKAQYLMARAAIELAQATYDRTVKLTRASAAPAKNELEALTALNQARASLLDTAQKLRNFRFTEPDLTRIAKDNDTTSLLEIVAPIAGTVTAWDATLGEAVEPTTQMFALADTSRMWIWIDVYEQDIATLASGQVVTFTISGMKEPVFTGQVTWVGTEVSPTTRTTRVRAEVDNPQGRLRANQFGQALIQVEPEHEALVVPRVAVQDGGGHEIVFLPVSETVYRPVRVKTVATDRDDMVEVVEGLTPGQRVVTTRSFILKSELFRDRLGAADND